MSIVSEHRRRLLVTLGASLWACRFAHAEEAPSAHDHHGGEAPHGMAQRGRSRPQPIALPDGAPPYLRWQVVRRREALLVEVVGGVGETLSIHAPGGEKPAPFPSQWQFRPRAAQEILSFTENRAEVRHLGVGNYHLLNAIARRGSERWHLAAAPYFSQPGPAPRAALTTLATGTAIVPERLPREHSHFQCGEVWRFRVVRDGRSQPGAPATLWLPATPPVPLTADGDGWVTVRFPEKLPVLRPGGRHGGPQPNPFLVATLWPDGVGAVWSDELYPNRGDSRSYSLGLGTLASVAAVTALVTLRSRPTSEEQR